MEIESRVRELYLKAFFKKQLKRNLREEARLYTHLTGAEKMQLFLFAKKTEGVFVEIGSYLGASASFLSAGIQQNPCKACLYCVDTWENDTMAEGKRSTFEEFKENTKKYEHLITPIKGKSTVVAGSFKRKVDLLFIDGDHSIRGVKADVSAWFPTLKRGSLVIFHDWGWADGVKKVILEDVIPLVKKKGTLPNMWWGWLK